MTSAGVAGMMFQCVFEGSLSMRDTEIERRPYHKNCSCALHKSKGAAASSKFSSPLVGDMSTSTSTSTGNRGSVNGVHNSALSHRQ
ncbi:hypothetical protein L3X38_040428 [Prunus dulcis]|uniref:Uncharacterized protein n=1 Tax=Prunus dulcis TaxID=3755 RepID=A0AAD4V930_PRUDU|nr:hypothetical protein L3X38_040428 [Prunus dulcis]